MYEGNDYRNYLMHRDHKYLDRIKTSYGWRYIYDKITNKGDGNSNANGNDNQYNFSSQRNNMSRNGFQRTGDAIRRNVQTAYAKFKNIGADKKHQKELDKVWNHMQKTNAMQGHGSFNDRYWESVDKNRKEGLDRISKLNYKRNGENPNDSNKQYYNSVTNYNIAKSHNFDKDMDKKLGGYNNDYREGYENEKKGATDYSNYKSPTDIKKARAEEKKALAEREARINQNATNRANKKKQDAQRRNAQNQIQEMANRNNALSENARMQREAINAQRAEAARKKQELASNAKRATLNSTQAKNTEMSYRYGGRGASEKAIREHQRNSEAAARQETSAKAARQKNVTDYDRWKHDLENDQLYERGLVTNTQNYNIANRRKQGTNTPFNRQLDLAEAQYNVRSLGDDTIRNYRLQDRANGYTMNNRNIWGTETDSVQRYNQTRRKRR